MGASLQDHGRNYDFLIIVTVGCVVATMSKIALVKRRKGTATLEIETIFLYVVVCAKASLKLLLAAPTWLWGCCGRHHSPPASSVMDIVFSRSDGSHVSVDSQSISASVFLAFFSRVLPSPETFFLRSLGLLNWFNFICWNIDTNQTFTKVNYLMKL